MVKSQYLGVGYTLSKQIRTRKARLVAKGYAQIPNIDYHKTFSPTSKITSIRTLMQIATQYNLVVHQLDVKSAYLNAPIDCNLYMEKAKGYEIECKNSNRNLVYKLNYTV